MDLRRISRSLPILAATTLWLGFGDAASAVTQFKEKRLPFVHDITAHTSSLSLPLKERIDTVRMSEQVMQSRLLRSAIDETVEPLTLMLRDDDAAIAEMVENLALKDQEDALAEYLKKHLSQSKPTRLGGQVRTVVIEKDGFELMDKAAFAELFEKTHHELTVDSPALKQDKLLRRQLLREIAPFFKKADRKAVLTKIMASQPIVVDRDLLPEFAQKMVRKYLIFRGPNCFHAALAFNSPVLTSSSLVNVKDETGYHRAMINYDELWRVLSSNFYEVDATKAPLKYGDMLVFFEVPEGADADLNQPIDFRWIRHTATHLFNGYTFSKGSKSPNTPYTVRTLAEEWKTWQRFTKNLGVKVFRRSQKSVKNQPPMDLADWMY